MFYGLFEEKWPWSYCGSFGPFPEDKNFSLRGRNTPDTVFISSLLFEESLSSSDKTSAKMMLIARQKMYTVQMRLNLFTFVKNLHMNIIATQERTPRCPDFNFFIFVVVNLLSYSLYL